MRRTAIWPSYVGTCVLAFVTQPTDAKVGANVTSVTADPAGTPVRVEVLNGPGGSQRHHVQRHRVARDHVGHRDGRCSPHAEHSLRERGQRSRQLRLLDRDGRVRLRGDREQLGQHIGRLGCVQRRRRCGALHGSRLQRKCSEEQRDGQRHGTARRLRGPLGGRLGPRVAFMPRVHALGGHTRRHVHRHRLELSTRDDHRARGARSPARVAGPRVLWLREAVHGSRGPDERERRAPSRLQEQGRPHEPNPAALSASNDGGQVDGAHTVSFYAPFGSTRGRT